MTHFRKIQQNTVHGSKTGYRCGGTGAFIGGAYIAHRPAPQHRHKPARRGRHHVSQCFSGSVGLSNILDSELGGRHPAEGPHG